MIFSCILGSPPRMRGKDQTDRKEMNFSGITPAYAGKRPNGQKRNELFRDHPRVCGEKTSSHVSRLLGLGSPPRMRGKD